MIHAIPFKVVHPCPRPRVVPPRHATTSTSLRPSLSPARLLTHSLFLSPSLRPTFSLALARPCAHTNTHHTQTRILSLSHTHSSSLSLSHYPPTGSPFLRVTTQWRCHTLAPSSNQCYCFIVPLLCYCFSILGKATHRSSIRLEARERRRVSTRASRSKVSQVEPSRAKNGTRLFYGLTLEPVFVHCAFQDKRPIKT